jgi:hypothetical protein
MFLQRTAATAPQVVRQPMVAANQKRNEAIFKKINKHLNQLLKYRKRQYCFQCFPAIAEKLEECWWNR